MGPTHKENKVTPELQRRINIALEASVEGIRHCPRPNGMTNWAKAYREDVTAMVESVQKTVSGVKDVRERENVSLKQEVQELTKTTERQTAVIQDLQKAVSELTTQRLDLEAEVEKRINRVEELKNEVDRLKEGRFTDEELQNLCHNLTCAQREAFEKGCREYTDRLFGADPPLPLIQPEVEFSLKDHNSKFSDPA